MAKPCCKLPFHDRKLGHLLHKACHCFRKSRMYCSSYERNNEEDRLMSCNTLTSSVLINDRNGHTLQAGHCQRPIEIRNSSASRRLEEPEVGSRLQSGVGIIPVQIKYIIVPPPLLINLNSLRNPLYSYANFIFEVTLVST